MHTKNSAITEHWMSTGIFFKVALNSLVRSSCHKTAITMFMNNKFTFEISMIAKLVARLESYGKLSKVIEIINLQRSKLGA